MDGGAQADGRREARRADHLDGLLAREVALPPPRVVSEDARRNQAGRRQREAAERAPDEVLGADDAGERASEGRIRAAGARRVEDDEVGVLLGRLDEAGRGSGARAGAPRGPGAGGRGPGRVARTGSPRRSRRPAGRRGTRSRSSRAGVPSSAAGCARGRRGPGVCSTIRNGPGADRGRRSRAAPTARSRWPSSRRSGATGRSGAGREAGSRSRRSERAVIPGDVRRVSLRGTPARPRIATKAAGIDRRARADRALERRLDGSRRSGASRPRRRRRGRRWSRTVRASVLERPAFAEVRREVPLGVRRDQGLEDVGQDLVLLGGLVRARLRGGDRVGHRHDERSASRESPLPPPSPRDRASRSRPDRRRPSRTRRAGSRRSRRATGARPGAPSSPPRLRRVDAALDPAAGVFDRGAPARPSPPRRGSRRRRGRRRFCFSKTADGGLGLAQRAVDVAGHAVALGEHQPRLALERRVARPLLVLEELERDLRDADRVLGAEGVERLLRELQSVLDRLLGHVALPEVVDELGVDALEPPGRALLDQLGVLAVEGTAAPARERSVEHVAHDSAREGQPVAARLALFLEDALAG